MMRSEFRWKEEIIYWEGTRGCVFPGSCGVDPPVTVVPTLRRGTVPCLGGSEDVTA
jgi:hypothetical protein